MHDISQDVAAVARIDALPTLLEVVTRITGMGFAAVARVTEDQWVACAVRDEAGFGIRAGGELLIETTICNEIRESGETVVIDHVDRDPRFCRHPTPAAYGFQSYISVPIVLRDGQFFGTLCAVDRKPAHVNRPDILGMFRLFAQLIAFHLDQRELVDGLEAEVSRRTAALREANDELARQMAITQEDQQSLRALAERLQHVREEERSSLARSLHDEFAQALATLQIDLAALRRAIERSTVTGSLTTVDGMRKTMDSMLNGVHRIVSDLRPLIFDALGLVAAATATVTEFERRSGVRAGFDADPEIRLSDDLGIALFRVLQEALTNVSRHADASSVDVSLHACESHVVLRVADDGRGVVPSDIRKPTAFGVKGMEERLRALGGSLQMAAREGGGTVLIARVPAVTAP